MNAEQRQVAADVWVKPAAKKLHPSSPFITTHESGKRILSLHNIVSLQRSSNVVYY